MGVHRACVEIDLDALKNNFDEIRRVIGSDVKMGCVIKSNAYGHGSVPLARELVSMGAFGFAVASLEEGIELRRHGITQPILVLGYVPKEDYADMITHDLIGTVYSYTMARDIDSVALDMNKRAKIHIKLDTGMSRIGFKADENAVLRIVMMHNLLPNVDIRGIYTHFSCADCSDREMTLKQFKRFSDVIAECEAQGIEFELKHCANSAAIMEYPETHMDMVRAGIILYGLYPSNEISHETLHLKQVVRLKSRVVHVKTVEKGTPVGYGASYICTRPTRIATVAIGYGDGYPRAMSGIGRVLIGSSSYPIIGRVCMDQLMVDITDAEDKIEKGEEVVLIGSQGTEMIPVEEVSDRAMSFNYEFVCGLGRRLPRVYTRGGKILYEEDYLSQIRVYKTEEEKEKEKAAAMMACQEEEDQRDLQDYCNDDYTRERVTVFGARKAGL